MATSAIGPGFLTQTSKFTEELMASFGFVILLSLLIDIGAQVNIWRVVTMSRLYAQDIANRLFPGLGFMLAALIAFGGLIFNIGNIAGCGLGLHSLAGLHPQSGAIISCILALAIFWYKEVGSLVDAFAKWLGVLMIAFTVYIAYASQPPVSEALYRTIWPERTNALMIVTLVGGTVGGYITFAGAHRLLEAGITGQNELKQVTISSISGIVITSVMRFVLFFAALGVVSQGMHLDPVNPAASVFEYASGTLGVRFFGFVMWCAAITSVVGASYTSLSFFKTLSPFVQKHYRLLVSLFIICSTLIFLSVGNPVRLLIAAGAVNGLILPIALSAMLLASRQSRIIGTYRHPLWLQVAGWLVVVIMSWMGIIAIGEGWKQLN